VPCFPRREAAGDKVVRIDMEMRVPAADEADRETNIA
jgi:hypothetical protein